MQPTPTENVANTWLGGLSKARPLGRRWSILAVVASAFLLYWSREYTIANLGNEFFLTGYSLLAICIALMALGVRKRIYHVQFGRVSLWQSAHHYLGTLCLIAYCLHAGIVTTGWLESTLAVLFWTILSTGFLSWYVNKTGPKMLRAAGVAILRSDIPQAKQQLAEEAYMLAMQAAGSAESAAIADYYRSDLSGFFGQSRSVWYRLFPSGRKKRSLQARLRDIERYLDSRGGEILNRLNEIIKLRDDLDFQSAIQHRIRLCATAHTLLLGAFVIVTIAHVWVAHQFSGHW